MHLTTRNVGTAFKSMVEGIHSGKIPTEVRPSRYGEVLQIEEPVILTYERPTECVLFNPYRDVPIPFLLYEALWMLAGRNDVAPLAHYLKRMREFSDDGETFNGAYGYRWRQSSYTPVAGRVCTVCKGKGEVAGNDPEDPAHRIPCPSCSGNCLDQLSFLIDHLRRKPESRRAVLQMWNVGDDLLKIDTSKDVCCNLSVLFSVEPGRCRNCEGVGAVVLDAGTPERDSTYARCSICDGKPHDIPRYLNMTVFNRSNDLVWGCLGANAVHFSFLQQYVAAHLRLEVGKYHQISNNLHAYTATWKPEEWLCDYEQGGTWSHEWYGSENYKSVPLVRDPETFDRELPLIVRQFSNGENDHPYAALPHGPDYSEPFLNEVIAPILGSYRLYSSKLFNGAIAESNRSGADDWRIGMRGWLERRLQRRQAKVNKRVASLSDEREDYHGGQEEGVR